MNISVMLYFNVVCVSFLCPILFRNFQPMRPDNMQYTVQKINIQRQRFIRNFPVLYRRRPRNFHGEIWVNGNRSIRLVILVIIHIHHNVNILFNHSNRSKPFFHIEDSLHICFYLADQSGIVIQIVFDSIAGQSNHSVKYPVRQKCSTGYDLPYRFYPASAFAHQESAQKKGMGSHAEKPILCFAGAAISGISISSAHRVVISFCVRLS